MDKVILKAEKRNITGRKINKLRTEGILPGNIYGKKVKSVSIQVDLKDLEEVFKKVGETGLVEILLEKEKRPVLIHNIQKNPVTDAPLHVEFLQVDLKEKVTAKVPVEIVGVSPAEKQGFGTVVQYINEVEVEALPEDLVSEFEIDASSLSEVDQAVYVKDLKVDPKKVKINTDPEQIMVKVEPPKKEEEVVVPVPEVTPEAGEVAPTTEGEAVTPAGEGETKEEVPKEGNK